MTAHLTAIQSMLDAVEREENAVVLLAVESGSRAWGFASSDSDYDIRFIYARPHEWYLSIDIEKRRDVIERPIRDALDLSGWDIRKALQLFRKSNPPLYEWLQCPIVYRERHSFTRRLRELIPIYYSPRATFFHYLHMAQGNIREYLLGDTVWRKKYFYVLRPLLAMRWIDQDRGPVPIEFKKLVDATVTDTALLKAVDALLAEKAAGAELDRGPRIGTISRFIETEMARLEAAAGHQSIPAPLKDALDALFRDTLDEIRGQGRRAPL
jgi:uncharacterized protein